MLKKDSNYRRLKLAGKGLMGTSSFWLAQDHLLVVEVINFVESYRRFYFRDIQALIVQKTKVQLGWSLGLGAGLLCSLAVLAAGLASSNYIAIGICGGLAVIFLVPLLWNLFMGPTCCVQVRTAVQTQALANLRRKKNADKLIGLLVPAVAAAQATKSAVEGAPQTAGDFQPPPGAAP